MNVGPYLNTNLALEKYNW